MPHAGQSSKLKKRPHSPQFLVCFVVLFNSSSSLVFGCDPASIVDEFQRKPYIIVGCTNTVFSPDDCNLNIESTCINGTEVNLFASVRVGTHSLNNLLQNWGFKNVGNINLQPGLSSADFKGQDANNSSSPMYNVVSEEGKLGVDEGILGVKRLCTYIPEANLKERSLRNDIDTLGKGKAWKTESVPSLLKGYVCVSS